MAQNRVAATHPARDRWFESIFLQQRVVRTPVRTSKAERRLLGIGYGAPASRSGGQADLIPGCLPFTRGCGNPLFAGLDPPTRASALARYTLQPIGIYEHPVRLQMLLDAAMGGESDLVPSCDEPRRSAPAPLCRAAQGEVVRARHRPLPDAQHAGRADRAADPMTVIGHLS